MVLLGLLSFPWHHFYNLLYLISCSNRFRCFCGLEFGRECMPVRLFWKGFLLWWWMDMLVIGNINMKAAAGKWWRQCHFFLACLTNNSPNEHLIFTFPIRASLALFTNLFDFTQKTQNLHSINCPDIDNVAQRNHQGASCKTSYLTNAWHCLLPSLLSFRPVQPLPISHSHNKH